MPSLSFKYRIAIIIFILEAIMMSTVLTVTLSHAQNKAHEQMHITQKVLINLLGDLSRLALITDEYAELQPYIENTISDPNVKTILLTNQKGQIVVSSDVRLIDSPLSQPEISDSHLWVTKDIDGSAGKLGTIAFEFSESMLNQASKESFGLGLRIALAGMFIIALVGWIIGHMLTRRLGVLTESVQQLSSGDLSVRTNFKGSDEISLVGRTFDDMASSIKKNIEELKARKDELEHIQSDLEDRVETRTKECVQAKDDAIQANLSKSQFLANMSHEIRTPITSIIGFAEDTLNRDQTMEERLDALKTIIRNSKHLLGIINDILDLSKVEANKLELEIRPILLVELLCDIESLVRLQAEKKDLVFGINYIFPIPDTIISDAIKIKQIVVNLVSNAIKFTEEGFVYVNVSYRPANRQMIFEVIDSGIGMSAEQLNKIFDPFTQADTSTTRKYGGTGLGLSLSKKLAEQLGGDITANSTEGDGSHFIFTLDVGDLKNVDMLHNKEQIEKSYIEQEIKSQLQNKSLAKLRGHVLLAEDNYDLQQLISLTLKRFGLDVDIAANGRIAVDMALKNDYDLICMDIQMPIMGGLEATDKLRKNGYKQPIIALTANVLKSDLERYLAEGFDETAAKPIERATLYSTLSKYLPIDDRIESKSDTTIISSILDDEPDMVDLVESYVRRLPGVFSGIMKCYEQKDLKEFRDQVHQLKGSGASAGFQILTELSGKIEFQLLNNNFSDVELLLKQMQDAVDCIYKQLPMYQEKLAAGS